MKKRVPVTVRVSLSALQRAIYIAEVFHKNERGKELNSVENEILDIYGRTYEKVNDRSRALIEACRRAQMLDHIIVLWLI